RGLQNGCPPSQFTHVYTTVRGLRRQVRSRPSHPDTAVGRTDTEVAVRCVHGGLPVRVLDRRSAHNTFDTDTARTRRYLGVAGDHLGDHIAESGTQLQRADLFAAETARRQLQRARAEPAGTVESTHLQLAGHLRIVR